jgi:hypothetical protein
MITFIIPSLNRPTLERSINSLVSQTNPNWECIVVYDGVDGISFNDDRIKTIKIDKLGGFDESLRHCFEDFLLNLKLTVSGYSNYYSPDSVAYHLESASRDIKTTNNEMIQDYNNILVPYIKNNFEKLKKFVLIN